MSSVFDDILGGKTPAQIKAEGEADAARIRAQGDVNAAVQAAYRKGMEAGVQRGFELGRDAAAKKCREDRQYSLSAAIEKMTVGKKA